MVFGNPINNATATMDYIYERLSWLYALVRSTLVCYGIGNAYLLSDLTELSRVQIPYSEQFVNNFDYEQNSILRDLLPKDILCTKSYWISGGRNPLSIADHHDPGGGPARSGAGASSIQTKDSRNDGADHADPDAEDPAPQSEEEEELCAKKIRPPRHVM